MDGYDVTELNVTGYSGQVPNQHWNTGSDTLMAMLPGAGYTNQMPLMFYMQEVAMRRRWDILQINYDYSTLPKDTSREELFQRLIKDVRAANDAVLANSDYARIVLVGKSLGTIAMTTLLQSGIAQDLTTFWLTPLIRRPEVREAMTATAARSAVVIGTRDDHYDPRILDEFRDQGAVVEEVEGGDHSLDIGGGVVASIDVLRDVIETLDGFLTDAVR